MWCVKVTWFSRKDTVPSLKYWFSVAHLCVEPGQERESMIFCISMGPGKTNSICPAISRNQAKEILTAVGVE